MIRPLLLFFLLLLPLPLAAQSGDDELVNVKELIPDIVIDLKYNTTDNFVSTYSGKPQKLYTTDECYLALGTAKRLIVVQDSLRKLGLGLKIFDGYRPRSVQYLMWEIFPNSTYVADPNSGSQHNRGAAADVTLVNLSTGQELAMPTAFDHFGIEASHGYTTGLTQEQIDNRALLRSIMTTVGGLADYSAEWWHYQYTPSTAYPLIDHQLK